MREEERKKEGKEGRIDFMSTERVLAEILTLILEASNTDILFPQIPLPWLSCFPTSFHFCVCSSYA